MLVTWPKKSQPLIDGFAQNSVFWHWRFPHDVYNNHQMDCIQICYRHSCPLKATTCGAEKWTRQAGAKNCNFSDWSLEAGSKGSHRKDAEMLNLTGEINLLNERMHFHIIHLYRAHSIEHGWLPARRHTVICKDQTLSQLTRFVQVWHLQAPKDKLAMATVPNSSTNHSLNGGSIHYLIRFIYSLWFPI